ncbi:MAG: Rrf2 family transcriptional regulator [Pseudomonadota bacterium]
MHISTKGRYAIMAMVDIANQHTNFEHSVVGLASISERQDISLAYLEQLFGKLRRAGLVQSLRGPGGGYSLAKTPDVIVLADIIIAVDEPVKMTRCHNLEGNKTGCVGGERCLTHGLWVAMEGHLFSFFQNITLRDILRGSHKCRPALNGQNFFETDYNSANTNGNDNTSSPLNTQQVQP